MPRRELDALRRHQIKKRIVLRRQGSVDRLDNRFILLRAGDCEDIGIGGRNALRFRTHAAGDDDLAVFLERAANGRKRFRLGAVEETAGVDDDEVGALVLARELIALRAQARDDTLAVDERLRAAEGDKAYFRRGRIGFSGLDWPLPART